MEVWRASLLCCWLGSGLRYQILSHVFARCTSQIHTDMRLMMLELHAKHACDYSMSVFRVQFSMSGCFLTRASWCATCKKVWHKSYTSGHCLLPAKGLPQCRGNLLRGSRSCGWAIKLDKYLCPAHRTFLPSWFSWIMLPNRAGNFICQNKLEFLMGTLASLHGLAWRAEGLVWQRRAQKSQVHDTAWHTSW